MEASWFHWSGGLFFRRAADGAVEIGAGSGFDDVTVIHRIDPSSWASIVASVSAAGETGPTFTAALQFHNGVVDGPDAGGIARMDIAEFQADGYLQEVNRRFLHPLGLALEIVVDVWGARRLGGVWDYRADPEGIYFAHPDEASFLDYRRKALTIDRLWADREPPRRRALGYVVQPLLETPGPAAIR